MKTRKLVWTTALVLVFLLAASLVWELGAHVIPGEVPPLAHKLFTDARKGDTTAETALFAKDARPDSRELRFLQQLLSAGGKPEFVSFNWSKPDGQPSRTLLTYRIMRGKQAYLVALDIRGPDGQRRLHAVDVYKPVDIFKQLPWLKHTLVILGLVDLALLAIVSAVVIWLVRRRRTRRKA